MHYTDKFLDSKVFDSPINLGAPSEGVFGRGCVIKGWDEDIALMKAGQSSIDHPTESAYETYGAGGVIPPNATPVYKVIVEVK